jgi:hypothetical protein
MARIGARLNSGPRLKNYDASLRSRLDCPGPRLKNYDASLRNRGSSRAQAAQIRAQSEETRRLAQEQ